MARVFVLGTYNPPASALLQVDLMRYLTAVGTPPDGIIFKTSSTGESRLNTIVKITENSVAVPVSDFNDPSTVELIRSLEPDLLVYAGGRDILRAPLLSSARLGCIGGHYGHLPQVRGMSTVEWSILLGEHEPTVAIQRIGTGIDTGEILMQARVHLKAGDTFTSIRERSYFMTKVMLAMTTARLLAGRIQGKAQSAADGKQYYRMHPLILHLAEKALAVQLGNLKYPRKVY
jgi:methionyl-tRNA formyltransferase